MKYFYWAYTTLLFFGLGESSQIVALDFDAQMGFDLHDPYKKKERDSIRIMRHLYDRNISLLTNPGKEDLIPHRVHVIWIGPYKPSHLFYACRESIRKHLPTWELYVWTDKEVSDLKLVNQKYYDEAESYAEKADILRYEILYRFGGLYIDTDVIIVKSLEPLHSAYEFYIGIQPTDLKGDLCNAVIGSVPGHPILQACVEGIKKARFGATIHERTGPSYIKQSFMRYIKNNPNRCIALPKTYFYPLDFGKRHLSYDEILECVKPETYAVHFWEGSWIP